MSVENYHRFYASLKRLPGGSSEDVKETLVWSFTDGRTTSLKEMTQKEYDAMCASLEERSGWKEQLRKARSLCLKLIQKAGIDTSDWQRINDFCRSPRIAGKDFARLGVKELEGLHVKLRAIISKGGLRRENAQSCRDQEKSDAAGTLPQPSDQELSCIVVPLSGMCEA